jgi:hypothetical protein
MNTRTFHFVLFDTPDNRRGLTDLQIQRIGVPVGRSQGEHGGEVIDEPHGNVGVTRVLEVGSQIKIVLESSGGIFGCETLS